MNCKPKDLARVINLPETRELGIVDKIIRVTVLSDINHEIPCWEFEGPPIPLRNHPTLMGNIECLPDKFLCPIRDPGDDAIDETLLRLPVPSTHRETETS